jgi:hypothetical protein
LAHLDYKKGKTYEDYLGARGLERSGKKKWPQHAAQVTKDLKTALEADYVVLGGGNSKKLKTLPAGAHDWPATPSGAECVCGSSNCFYRTGRN